MLQNNAIDGKDSSGHTSLGGCYQFSSHMGGSDLGPPLGLVTLCSPTLAHTEVSNHLNRVVVEDVMCSSPLVVRGNYVISPELEVPQE